MSLNPLLDPHEDTSFFGSDLVENQGIAPNQRVFIFQNGGQRNYVELWSKITSILIEADVQNVNTVIATGVVTTTTTEFSGEADRDAIDVRGLPWVGPALHPQRPINPFTNIYCAFVATGTGTHTIAVSGGGGTTTTDLTTARGSLQPVLEGESQYVDTLGDITQAVWQTLVAVDGGLGLQGDGYFLQWGDFDQGATLNYSASGSDNNGIESNAWTQSFTIQILTT